MVYKALVTVRVVTDCPHDNPMWLVALDMALAAGKFEVVEVAKPFQGEPPCEQHGQPK